MKHIAHAYLVVGECSNSFAEKFAKEILDNELLNHPDYSIITGTQSSIKIEEIRELTGSIYEKPIKSSKKVYIICNAEKLTKEASNALLKTLEEPPEYATIILAVKNEYMLLNTIKSRCVKIPIARTGMRPRPYKCNFQT